MENISPAFCCAVCRPQQDKFSKSTRRPFLAALLTLSLFGKPDLSNGADLSGFRVVTAWISGYFLRACLLLPGIVFRWTQHKNFQPEREALSQIAVTNISAIYYYIISV